MAAASGVVYRCFSMYSTSMLSQRSLCLADWFASSRARSSPSIAERHTILLTAWGYTLPDAGPGCGQPPSPLTCGMTGV
jgi:hypothetical protein